MKLSKLAAVWIDLVCISLSATAADTFLVNHSELWNFHKGTNAPQTFWRTIADSALDTSWASGLGGFGYADNTPELALLQTQLADMRREYPSTPEEAFEASIEGAYFADQLATAELHGRIGDHRLLPDRSTGSIQGGWFSSAIMDGYQQANSLCLPGVG